MGRWSRAVGEVFLDWVGARPGGRWLDVGCGTGSFSQLILDKAAPTSLVAIDPAEAQLTHGRPRVTSNCAVFRVADADALPFDDNTFDVVASALVINFISDQARALSEMRRVAVRSGIVAGYVWDFAAELSPSWPLRIGLRNMGVDVAQVPGASGSSPDGLRALFERAGLEQISVRSIEATVTFLDFENFWRSQTLIHNPIGNLVSAMSESDRSRLTANVQAVLPKHSDGHIEYSARANAIKAHVPDKSSHLPPISRG